MNSVKGFALVACLAMPLSTIVAVTSAPAETATDSKPAMTTPDAKTTKTAMSDADKRAKAADCSKQADDKKLHGEARKKFRAECKKK